MLSVSILWATSNSPSQMTLNNKELIVSLNWKSTSKVGVSIGHSGHSCSVFLIPLTGLSSAYWPHSQAGFPCGGNSKCTIDTPNIWKKKGISFIDCLLRMRKLLFRKPPSCCALCIWLGSPAYFWAYPCAQVNATSNLGYAYIPKPISIARTVDLHLLKHMV